MLNKIFLMAVIVFAIAMTVLTYLTYSQLQHIGFAPAVIAENYQKFEGYYFQFLWISSVILLIFGNVILWKLRKSWAMWAALLYFAVFMLIQGWWLGSEFANYNSAKNLMSGSFYGGGLFSTILCIIAAVAVFFDQFIVLRLRDRVYNTSALKEPSANELQEKLVNKSE